MAIYALPVRSTFIVGEGVEERFPKGDVGIEILFCGCVGEIGIVVEGGVVSEGSGVLCALVVAMMVMVVGGSMAL